MLELEAFLLVIQTILLSTLLICLVVDLITEPQYYRLDEELN